MADPEKRKFNWGRYWDLQDEVVGKGAIEVTSHLTREGAGPEERAVASIVLCGTKGNQRVTEKRLVRGAKRMNDGDNPVDSIPWWLRIKAKP